jgi:hypothetical protein
MAFRIKKSYSGKIQQDQAKFTIPGDEINPEPTLLKSAVDGTTIGRKDVYTEKQTKSTTGAMKIRKTPYVYADR